MTHPEDTGVAPPESTDPPEPEAVPTPFLFTGNASEYFRIWIVNVALSIATLGVYSAWAKVRTRQYFYRHTWLDGASFDYLADPRKILKGRILAAGALGILLVAERVSALLYVAVALALLFATPWVLVQASRFNARNSAWRNVRFSFSGTTKGAAFEYVNGMLIAVVTFGLGASYLQWKMFRFRFEHLAIGKTRFRYLTPWGDFLGTNLAAGMLFFLAFALVFLPVRFLFGVPADEPGALRIVPMLAPLAGYFVVFAFMRARLANITWGGVQIGAHRLISDQGFLYVLWLQLTNLLAIVCTLGLAVPWAKVRNHRYRLARLQLHAVGPLVLEAEPGGVEGGAVGDALADLGDFDLGFG